MQAKALTQQLLTFSKGGSPVLRTVSMRDLLKESVNLALSGSNVRCDLSLPDDLWPTEIDDDQIKQVVNNLIINSQQAMPEGGIIRVRAGNIAVNGGSGLPLLPGEYIKVSFADEGVGIPQEHLPKIFDPFFTTKQKGSGLGLYLVQTIANIHNWKVTAKSPGVGQGAVFTLTIPEKP